MARSDLILNLVKAAIAGDQTEVRATAAEIAVDERSKKRTGVAERINKLLENSDRTIFNDRKPVHSMARKNGYGGFHRLFPDRSISSLFLEDAVRNICQELIEEQRRSELLRSSGIEPRHKVLLVGPPGNGKTSLAECIASELALPLLFVKYDAIVTSYLGETAQRLSRLFNFVSTEPCVLFFDEFDAIGKERGDIHETGEIKRIVTSLLLQVDTLPSYCVLVAATNHPELLDRASLRRFQIKLELKEPTEVQMIEYFNSKLKKFNGTAGYTAKRLFNAVSPKNYSEAEDFFLDINRRLILEQGNGSNKKLFEERINVWNSLKKETGD